MKVTAASPDPAGPNMVCRQPEVPTRDGQTRRRIETRRRLLQAARRLFVQRGFHATRPQDIARAAGVAAGTFYLHFDNKGAAFLAFAEQVQDQLAAEYRANLTGVVGLRSRLTIILRTLASFAGRHPGVLHVAFSDPIAVAPEDPKAWCLYDRLGDFVQAALGDERIVCGYDLSLVSHALCGFIGNASVYAARKSVPLEHLIDNVVSFIERALDGPRSSTILANACPRTLAQGDTP
jgi:AcrR family transcriptional regulator